MSSELNVIEAQDLSKGYQLFLSPADRLRQMLFGASRFGNRSFSALSGVSFSLQRGEVLGLVGRNGAGKSTLLSTLAGLREPSAGCVLLGGEDSQLINPRIAATRRAWLGQFQSDPFGSSVLETALTGRHPHLGRWDWESEQDLRIAREALLAVGLHGFETRDIQTLSGGERQRLAIATLLTQQPKLFLLDEPLAHLDLNHQIAVLDLFHQQRLAGAALISVLHEPALAWRYADKILLVNGDGHTALGSREEMLTEERLSALYGHPLKRFSVDGQVGFLPL